MDTGSDELVGRPRFRHRWAAIAGVLVLSPICAEYLIGYGPSTDKPLELLAGLVVFTPLYGTVAVLIREVTRRTGRGWPTILLLGMAFGVIQAGLIDQSLFFSNVDPDSPGWAKEERVTIVPGTGVDVATLLNYVGGHMIWSFAAPIAVVEACAPRIAERRWLGPVGIVVMLALWVLAAALVFGDTAAAHSTASAAQLIGASLASVTLMVAAFKVRPPTGPRSVARAPKWWLAGCATAAVLFANQLLPANWLGATLNIVALLALGWLLLRWSRREGWSRGHVLAVAGSALLVRALLSFLVDPLGDVDTAMKLAVNGATLIGVVALLVMAAHRVRR